MLIHKTAHFKSAKVITVKLGGVYYVKICLLYGRDRHPRKWPVLVSTILPGPRGTLYECFIDRRFVIENF